jgi:flagellar assembly protein FliH
MSTIIKASAAPQQAERQPFRFSDLGGRAQEYLEQVRSEAAAILRQAHEQAAAIRSAAEEDGRDAARAVAEESAEERFAARLTTLVPALRQAVADIQASKADWCAHWERTAIQVATAIAERIIRRQVDRAPEITLSLIKEALELAAGSGEIQLRMHPDDVTTLGASASALVGELNRLDKTQIIADDQIDRGSCRVDTRFGTIDQQFPAQLARIEQELA